MISGIVFDIKKFSIHDGPGIRTTVFLKGCPLNCWWCHNPESQELGRQRMYRERRCIRCGACLAACEQGALSMGDQGVVTDVEKCTLCGSCVDACYAEAREIVGRQMTITQVMDEIERDVAFYDESGGGVTISGGEPLMQPAFLLGLLQACKEMEIHTALDTCGYAAWDTLDRVRHEVDLFLYDLKLMDAAEHLRFTGVSNELILKNLRELSQRGQEIVLRVPIIPGVTDGEENLGRMGAFAAELPNLQRVDILPYHQAAADKYERLERVYGLQKVGPPSEGAMNRVADLLRAFELTVKIGG